jgi:hypothetical protein
MADQHKRLAAIAAAILIIGSGVLLLPLMKLRIPPRPSSVPPAALYARGREANYWINCPNVTSPTRYYCAVYSSDGSIKLVQGIFQESGATTPSRIAYDGSSIHWKHGAVLNPLHLDCVAGGQPPDVPDCGAGTR